MKTVYRLLESEILKKIRHVNKMCAFIEKNYPIEGDEEANQQIREGFARLRVLLEELRGPYGA